MAQLQINESIVQSQETIEALQEACEEIRALFFSKLVFKAYTPADSQLHSGHEHAPVKN